MCLVLGSPVALRQEEAADYLEETDRLVLTQLGGRIEQTVNIGCGPICVDLQYSRTRAYHFAFVVCIYKHE